MSLRDRLRRREPTDSEDVAAVVASPDRTTSPGNAADTRRPAVARDDVTDFDPRSDGDYHCPEQGLYLRFARPAVTETGAGHPDPAHGEFTQSGRFVVQRRFGRPVVYTVLEHRVDSLTVRRTDTSVTGEAGTAELRFAFEPDPDAE